MSRSSVKLGEAPGLVLGRESLIAEFVAPAWADELVQQLGALGWFVRGFTELLDDASSRARPAC